MHFCKFLRIVVIWTSFALLFLQNGLYAQENGEYTICYDAIDVRNVHGGFLDFGKKIDIFVSWCVTRGEERQSVTTLSNYKVYCSEDPNFRSGVDFQEPIIGDSNVTFKDKEYGKKYYFKIEAFDPNANKNIVSETEEKLALSIKKSRYASGNLWNILGGSVAQIWKVFWRSTFFGKLAFLSIVVLFVLGCFCWKRSKYIMRPTRLFPTKEELNDHNPQNKINQILEVVFGRNPNPNNPEDANMISVLKDVTLTRERFYGHHFRFLNKKKDNLPNRSHKDETDFADLPTLKILHSGVKEYDKAMQSGVQNPEREKIQNALRSRTDAEVEKLRKRSLVDWIWNLGFTEPLLGLFGTVTGLVHAFKNYGGDPKKLADGIYEALFTTVFGLFAGIILMLAYYYYSYVFDRISSDWGVMDTEFSERI